MNLKKIKEVVNLDISDEQKEIYILSIIADDKKAIPTIRNILNSEREKREELMKMIVKLKEICESEIPEFNIPELNELINDAVS